MDTCQTSAGNAGLRAVPAWSTGERVTWLAILCLLGALFLVHSDCAPARGVLLANPLALALFAMVYILIRIREAGGRL